MIARSAPSENARLRAGLSHATARLLALRHAEGYWEGCLSSSALATATAISALAAAQHGEDAALIGAGVVWLARTQRADGGWGDTPESPSNLATTLLVLAALTLAAEVEDAESLRGFEHEHEHDYEYGTSRERARDYLRAHGGDTPTEIVRAIRQLYGADRTFAVPILMNCALAGLVPWAAIPGLPFELAVLPASWFKLMRLHVVSYALPALIAIGLLLERRHPARNPLLRLARRLATRRALEKLAHIQPRHGGFLEATPLTAFVTMSLLAAGNAAPAVSTRGLHFLRQSVRADGSWPIDSNLSVWVTTSAVSALAHAGALAEFDTPATAQWLRARQYRLRHPLTDALPGGWGWTHLPGGVPDADDTCGALLALATLGERAAVPTGLAWLLQMQNADGGWPTFCRGWGSLPFDTSTPDVTAHALRALRVHAAARHARAVQRGFRYLAIRQRADGAWTPLWFGNQMTDAQENPVLGTARVLLAYAAWERADDAAQAGVRYLLAAQNPDGGWGGGCATPSSMEESALALSALTQWPQMPGVETAVSRGAGYLLARIEAGTWEQATPIGLYFARLWYAERLYPILWTVEALGRVARLG